MKKNYILKCCIISFVIMMDLLTKILFKDKEFSLIPGLIGINFLPYLNEGASFNLFEGNTPFLVVISMVMIVFMVLFDMKYKPKSKLYCVGISFVIGGAIGNLIDRIVLGGVRDFIFFEFWRDFPVFNVADCFLVIGVVILIIFILFFNKEENKKEDKK